ncbi:MAG: CHC2 zinc finger domain-containing protein [Chloroflexi bacterium]|nr:CHC2 zinc finger domain-containing protein [Chloroflexota bacterium]
MPSLRNDLDGFWATAYDDFESAVTNWSLLFTEFGCDPDDAVERGVRWAVQHGYNPPGFVRKQPRHGETIAEIKARTRIEDVADRLTPMRWTGNRGRGPCPLHKGNNASSFTVYRDTQSFYCWTCAEGGDVITLLRRTDT